MLRYIFDAYFVCFATCRFYFKKSDLTMFTAVIEDTVNASSHLLRYSLPLLRREQLVYAHFCYSALPHARSAWSNNSLIHFAVIEMLLSHLVVNYDRLFTQTLDWHWFEDF